jgi:elongation factor P hydroxylase
MPETQTILPDVNELILLFNRLFKESENTILVKGEDEPIYLPANDESPYNQIVFAHGYFTSALHEVSHWCIAGNERRKRVDFGYWYEPDGRSIEQQLSFEKVEVKPQALEWLFSMAAGIRFNISADNLNGEASPSAAIFKSNVHKQSLAYLRGDIPANAQTFIKGLEALYANDQPLEGKSFLLTSI